MTKKETNIIWKFGFVCNEISPEQKFEGEKISATR
jgi:hypothetical protein